MSFQQTARFTATGQTLSLVRQGEPWVALVRSGERLLFRVLGHDGRPAQDEELDISRELPRFGPGHSDFFLCAQPDQDLALCVLSKCAQCSIPGVVLHSRALRATAGPWVATTFSDTTAARTSWPMAGPHGRLWPAVPPPATEAVVATMFGAEPSTVLSLANDGDHLLSADMKRVCLWSLLAAERLLCAPRRHPSYRFLDSKRLWVWNGSEQGQDQLGIWNTETLTEDLRNFEQRELQPAHEGERFIAMHPTAEQLWDFEVFRWGHATADWTHHGCADRPRFTRSDDAIMCARDMHTAVRLHPATGAPLYEGKAMPLEPYVLGSLCELEIWNDLFSSTLMRNGRALAVVYELSEDAWALALPDGRFTGSPNAEQYLAFYDPNGAPLTAADVAALRQPQAVRASMRGLGCGR